MANLNISEVHLLNVPLENDYKNTLYFTSLENQRSYFASKKVKSYTDLSYQRKNNIIRVPENIDSLWNCNYVMYQNKAFSNKWFYCFIKDMKMINDGTTEIQIETDCIQTWFFDYNVKESFVEREHVSNDSVGTHTIPEGLELGEYVVNSVTKKESLNYKGYLIGSTIDLSQNTIDEDTANVGGAVYNGVFSGVKYYYFGTKEKIVEKLKAVAEAGKSDAIVSIFCVPTTLIDGGGTGPIEEGATVKSQDWDYAIMGGASDVSPNKPTTLNGYTPHNNKLKVYPYQYLYASNNSGGSAIYHYELFSTDKTDFKLYSVVTPGMSVKLVPKNYNNIAENVDCGLNLGKFPTCSWNNDAYTNWLTQNAVNIGVGVASSALTIAGGIGMMATGGGALAGGGMVASGALSIASSLGQVYEHSLIPPQAQGNLNSGDVTFSSGNLTFTLYQMSIKQEYAKIIDKYFDMFGYKVNRVKKPNKAHRGRWWYTKTIDVNIDGAIPNNDLNKIKEAYNNGITFWRNGDEIQNYSLSNGIAISDNAVTD